MRIVGFNDTDGGEVLINMDRVCYIKPGIGGVYVHFSHDHYVRLPGSLQDVLTRLKQTQPRTPIS